VLNCWSIYRSLLDWSVQLPQLQVHSSSHDAHVASCCIPHDPSHGSPSASRCRLPNGKASLTMTDKAALNSSQELGALRVLKGLLQKPVRVCSSSPFTSRLGAFTGCVLQRLCQLSATIYPSRREVEILNAGTPGRSCCWISPIPPPLPSNRHS
jgi:hypothetical protein